MPFVQKQARLILRDSNLVQLAVLDDAGGFSASNLQENNASAVAPRNRGRSIGWVEGDDENITFSFPMRLEVESVSHASAFRFWDAIFGTGSLASVASDNEVSTGPTAYVLDYEMAAGGVTTGFRYHQSRMKASFDESGETSMYNVEGEALSVTPF